MTDLSLPAVNAALLSEATGLLLTPAGLDAPALGRILASIHSHDVHFADLYFQYSRVESWSLEEGIVKSGAFNIDRGVGVRAVHGEKQAFAYSDEISMKALERMPSRIFVYAMNDKQRACVTVLMAKMKDTDRTNIVIPGFSRATWSGDGHEVRVFRSSDVERANSLVKIFNDVGLPVILKDLSGVEGSAAKARANTFELWFGQRPVVSPELRALIEADLQIPHPAT